MATATKLTYDDYAALPDDGRRYELIEGELVVNPAPNLRHQFLVGNLYFELSGHVRQHGGGKVVLAPADVVPSRENVVQPDILFVSAARTSILTEANVQGVPDLVIEVLSDSTRRKDEITKWRLYDRYGVTEYWVVDPAIDVIKVYRRGAVKLALVAELRASDGDVLESPLFPGLKIELAKIFVER